MGMIEALLYASGNPLTLTELCAHLQLESERKVSTIIDKISKIYMEDGSALEIKKLPGNRVVLQLKPRHMKQAKRFSMKPLLTSGPLKTLSYLAYNQPIEQTEIAKARGSHSYSHLNILEDMGLIDRKKKGRTKVVKTTTKFADYLGLSHNTSRMKRQLKKIFKRFEVKEIEKK
jgi:segregation and condensation protein B